MIVLIGATLALLFLVVPLVIGAAVRLRDRRG